MILNRAGLDFTKAANLMWAPNRAGQHTFGNLEQVVQKLRKIERTAQPSRNSKLRRSSKKVTNMNPVLQAIKNDDLETFARLVGNDEALRNGPNAFGSWLHYASSKGRLPFVKYLVENGADVNLCADTYDAGSITYAAEEGHLDVMDYLLRLGAKTRCQHTR